MDHSNSSHNIYTTVRPRPQHGINVQSTSTAAQDTDSSSSSTSSNATVKNFSASLRGAPTLRFAASSYDINSGDDDADEETDTPNFRPSVPKRHSYSYSLSSNGGVSPPKRTSTMTPQPSSSNGSGRGYRRRQTRRYFTPPESRSQSPVRPPIASRSTIDLSLSVETMPQDPDIFADPETDYFSMAEGRDEFANNLARRLRFVDAVSSQRQRQSMGAVLMDGYGGGNNGIGGGLSRMMPGGLDDLDGDLAAELGLGRSRFH